MSSHQMQSDINHGGAAGSDSQTGINAPMGVSDNVLHDVNKFVPSAMARGFSPGALADDRALDEALTDDSLGLTPPKTVPMRGRARSLLRVSATGRPPLTKRSPSWATNVH